jgi:hypothetical protein
MKNENGQKKEYTVPTMRVIELEHQARLMTSSPVDLLNPIDPLPFDGELF